MSGFKLYGATAGIITIQIVYTSLCGQLVPCSVYFVQNPFPTTFTVAYTYSYTITTGLNTFTITPITVSRGYFILLTQTTGCVAIDTTGTAQFSDLLTQSSNYYPINSLLNYRLYLTTVNSYSTYQASFNLQRTYASIGSYTLTISFRSSSQVYTSTVAITNCNLFIYLFLRFL